MCAPHGGQDALERGEAVRQRRAGQQPELDAPVDRQDGGEPPEPGGPHRPASRPRRRRERAEVVQDAGAGLVRQAGQPGGRRRVDGRQLVSTADSCNTHAHHVTAL